MTATFFIVLTTVCSINCLFEKPCNKLKIGNSWYEKEALWSGVGKPYNLYVHKATNTLFFSYTVAESYSDIDFQLAFLRIDSKEYRTIAGITGGFCVAIDQDNDDIYLGGNRGIYKYNRVSEIADFYKEEGANIWSLFYKNNLFYISYPDQKLHMEMGERFTIVEEFQDTEMDHLHININNVIYFANKTGFYKYNNTNRNIEIIDDLVSIRQITEDNHGNMYLSTSMGLYKFNGHDEMLQRVLDMKNVQGLAFDKDNNFVLSDEKSIMKLTKSNTACLENDEHW